MNLQEINLAAAVGSAVETRDAFRDLLGRICATLSIEKNWDDLASEDPAHRIDALAALQKESRRWRNQYQQIELAEFAVFAGGLETKDKR